jgi:hypothetical protein
MVTPKGERLTAAAQEALLRYFRPAYAQVTERQQEQLLATLHVLHGQLCAEDHAAKPVSE